ncbi:predicted protein [Histoplasma capsulatum var. duboisii H88]|uniref:Predicted protein n=2 Tax=Ajellomyces capsulatus TaxID=5037 RepID=F0UHU7_AJEC8|nr:predicted protein [Histoplasma capsulatum H143]EGC45456.1 predicted protein [Histoplasma capsulatum var. duboisii H88]
MSSSDEGGRWRLPVAIWVQLLFTGVGALCFGGHQDLRTLSEKRLFSLEFNGELSSPSVTGSDEFSYNYIGTQSYHAPLAHLVHVGVTLKSFKVESKQASEEGTILPWRQKPSSWHASRYDLSSFSLA